MLFVLGEKKNQLRMYSCRRIYYSYAHRFQFIYESTRVHAGRVNTSAVEQKEEEVDEVEERGGGAGAAGGGGGGAPDPALLRAVKRFGDAQVRSIKFIAFLRIICVFLLHVSSLSSICCSITFTSLKLG